MLHTEHTSKTDYLDALADAMVDQDWDDDVRDVRYAFDLRDLNIDPAEH